MIILSTAYLGNIQYYTKLLQTAEPVAIEQHENFVKQSFRSRCDILGANGPVSLSVPVYKTSGEKTPIREVRIDYSKAWQHQHWNSIHSAYKNSPYFDYFGELFEPFYQKKTEFLWDLNARMQETIFGILGISPEFTYSEEYVRPTAEDKDFRNSLSPKPRLHQTDPAFTPETYYQVFSERAAFVPNLSIIDLIFCEGPQAAGILRRSISPAG